MGGATLFLWGFTKEAGPSPPSSKLKLWQSVSEILYFVKILPGLRPGSQRDPSLDAPPGPLVLAALGESGWRPIPH